jgi:hypothetical protein
VNEADSGRKSLSAECPLSAPSDVASKGRSSVQGRRLASVIEERPMRSALLASTTQRPAPDEPQGVDPILVPMRKAMHLSGLSRSTIYLRAAAGELILRKAGRSTLVDYASLRALLDGLPTAQLKNAA